MTFCCKNVGVVHNTFSLDSGGLCVLSSAPPLNLLADELLSYCGLFLLGSLRRLDVLDQRIVLSYLLKCVKPKTKDAHACTINVCQF